MQLKNSLTAAFDCRQYKKDTPRTARPMVEAGGRINLVTSITEEELTEEVKQFARLSDKNGMYYLTFKVFPKNCKIYTSSAKQVEFPSLDQLDGGRFEVKVEFSVKHGTGTELNGLYANAIQIIRRADNPFEVVEGGSDDFISSPIDDISAPASSSASIAAEDITGISNPSKLPF